MAPTPDEHELDNPKVRQLLNDIANKIGSALPKDWGFTLFLFNYDQSDPQLFYISNAQREAMLQVLYEFIARQHILQGGRDGNEAKMIVATEISRVIAAVQDNPILRCESDALFACAERMQERGGSFVKVLAELYMLADAKNQQKVLMAWSNYFLDYAA